MLPSKAPSDTIRSELRKIIENVIGANKYRYNATDNAGHTMDTAKIIQDLTGEYFAIYHTYTGQTAKINLATSRDLMNWTWIRELAGSNNGSASQPTIAALPNGGFVTAWEQEPNNHLAFRYFSSRTHLITGTISRSHDAPQTLSAYAEGTPNIYSVTLSPDIDYSTIDIGHHYFWNGDRDRQARGTLRNFNSWTTEAQPGLDNALLHWGIGGNIGDREAIWFKGYQFAVIEGQYTKGDFGSWRTFLFDFQTGNADKTTIHTHRKSIAFANPTLTHIRTPDGENAIVITLFIPHNGAAHGEAGELIYYKTY